MGQTVVRAESEGDMSEDRLGDDVLRDTAELFRVAFENASIGKALMAPDGRPLRVNQALCEMLGYPERELLALSWRDITHPEDLEATDRAIARAVEAPSAGGRTEKRYIRKDGSILWADVTTRAVMGPGGAVRLFISNLIDISERKRAEEALRRSEALLVRVQEGSSDGFGDFEAATGRVSVTQRYCEIHGLPAGTKEISAEALMAHVDPADLPRIQADMAAIGAGETDEHVWEYRIRRADGTPRWLRSRGRVVGRDAGGRPVHVSGAITDITERKMAEEALRASEEQYRSLLDNLNAGVVVHAPDTSILLSNLRASTLLGLSADQMRGKDAVDPAWRFVREDGTTMPPEEYPVAVVLATSAPMVDQVIGIDRPATGDRAWVLVNAYPELGEAHRVRRVVVTFLDITLHKRAEAALRLETALVNGILRSTPVGFAVLRGPDFRYELVSPAYQAIAPGKSLIGNTYAECWPEFAGRVIPVMTARPGDGRAVSCGERPVRHRPRRYRSPGGDAYFSFVFQRIPPDEGGQPALLVTVVETTLARNAEEERTRMRAVIASKDRLAALGTLVAGTAHEINNPLAAVISGQGVALEVLQELKERLARRGPLDPAEAVRLVEDAARRSATRRRAGRASPRSSRTWRSSPVRIRSGTRARLEDVVDAASALAASLRPGRSLHPGEEGGRPGGPGLGRSDHAGGGEPGHERGQGRQAGDAG